MLGLSFIGLSYLIVVRFCAMHRYGSYGPEQYVKLFPASDLGEGESPTSNRACPLKGEVSSNREERVTHRADSPMVKAILLESHPSGTPQIGFYLALHRIYAMYSTMIL